MVDQEWTPEEDEQLLQLVENLSSWEDIAKHMSNRSDKACRTRFHEYLQGGPDVVPLDKAPAGKGSWYSLEEDDEIVRLKLEGLDWKQMARRMPGRAAKSLSRRFRLFLEEAYESPQKRMRWFAHEDELVLELRRDGLTWDTIAKHVSRHDAIGCEMRFNRVLSRIPQQDAGTEAGPSRSTEQSVDSQSSKMPSLVVPARSSGPVPEALSFSEWSIQAERRGLKKVVIRYKWLLAGGARAQIPDPELENMMKLVQGLEELEDESVEL